MPTLFRSDDCRVMMYPNDHLPPHVHVLMRDGRDCTVDLVTLAINGRVQAREIRVALAWIAAEQANLLNEWQRYNP